MLNAFDLDPPVFSPLRARAMLVGTSSAGSLHVPAVLVAHPEETARTEAGVLDDAGLRSTAGTEALPRHVATFFRGFGFLLRHAGAALNKARARGAPPAGLVLRIRAEIRPVK